MRRTVTRRWRSAIAISGLAAALLAGHGAAAPQRAAAETLFDALALAYQTNPTLRAQIAALRATNEQVPQALSGYRPTVNGSSEAGRRWNQIGVQTRVDPQLGVVQQGGSTATAVNPADIGITVSQPIYTGGRTEAS